jgi:hypothetical protein
MLKRLKIYYYLKANDEKKHQMKTFYKLCQKYGHIHCIGEDCFNHLETLQEMIELVKKFNVKFTVSSHANQVMTLMNEDQASFLELVEHIDYLSLNINQEENNLKDIQKIIDIVQELNGNVEINTVLSDANKSVQLMETLKGLTFDQWIVYTHFNRLKDEDINHFLELNQHPKLLISLLDCYVIASGEVVTLDRKVISSVYRSGKQLAKDLIDKSNYYQARLNQNSAFPYKLDKKRLDNEYYKIISGQAIFFDIEAVSRKSTNVIKHKITDFPIPILYALIRIEKGMLKVAERESYSVQNADDLESIYHQFFKTIKAQKIEYIVVSNGDLERRFIENMMYYLRKKLSLEDVRYLFHLRDQMIDIQQLLDQRLNSYKLLMEMKEQYPDIITFSKKADKLSIKINFILDGLIFGPKQNNKTLQKVVHYCFEDVYADFELFKFYCLIDRHKLG